MTWQQVFRCINCFTFARGVGNLWSNCLWVNILRHKAKSEGCPVPSIGANGNILLKLLRIFFLPSKINISF